MVARLTLTMLRILTLLWIIAPMGVSAQESVKFGDWRAFCAPVAGCVLGVRSSGGDALAFVEPPSGDDRLILVLNDPVRNGAEVSVWLDGQLVVTLGPADGWRLVDSAIGPAVQIAPSVVREGLMEPMRRRDRLEIGYPAKSGLERRILFSLNGYADTRGYADDG